MIIGVKLGNVREEDKPALRRFLNKHCFAYDFVLKNILKVGKGLFIYTTKDLDEITDNLPFIDEIVETKEGQLLLVSAVNSIVEIPTTGYDVIRLLPTEYFYAPVEDYDKYRFFIERNILRCFSGGRITDIWILARGYWRDDGIWIDSDVWKDGI